MPSATVISLSVFTFFVSTVLVLPFSIIPAFALRSVLGTRGERPPFGDAYWPIAGILELSMCLFFGVAFVAAVIGESAFSRSASLASALVALPLQAFLFGNTWKIGLARAFVFAVLINLMITAQIAVAGGLFSR